MKNKKIMTSLVLALILILQLNNIVFAASKKNSNEYSAKDVKLLACLIYTEAGNHSYKGKVAVGDVVLNRIGSSEFSHCKTIKDVIYDNKWAVQFGVTIGGSKSPLSKALRNYTELKKQKQMQSCIKAAKAALNGDNTVGKRLYFTRYSKSLAKKHPNHMKISSHIFY